MTYGTQIRNGPSSMVYSIIVYLVYDTSLYLCVSISRRFFHRLTTSNITYPLVLLLRSTTSDSYGRFGSHEHKPDSLFQTIDNKTLETQSWFQLRSTSTSDHAGKMQSLYPRQASSVTLRSAAETSLLPIFLRAAPLKAEGAAMPRCGIFALPKS